MYRDHKIFLIAACDAQHGIGIGNRLPWHLKKEMAHFQKITTTVPQAGLQNMVIMGRKTWESIPVAHRPLAGRRNVVLTREHDYRAEGAQVVRSLDEAYALADAKITTIFVIGGATLYAESIKRPDTDGVYLTRIEQDFGCDAFFPEIPAELRHEERLLGEEVEEDSRFRYWLYLR